MKELSGKNFSKWNVLKLSHIKEYTRKDGTILKRRYWKCKCVCGNIKDVLETNLISGKSKGCVSCAKRKTNIIGTKINEWEIIKQDRPDIAGRSQWLCLCPKCKKEAILSISRMKKQKSCKKCIQFYKDGKYISGTHFYAIKSGAKKRSLEFNITIKDIDMIYELQNGMCAISGIKLIPSVGIPANKSKLYNMSIDRIDNTKGYIKNNIQLVDDKFNYLKWKFTMDELIEMCKMVVEYNK